MPTDYSAFYPTEKDYLSRSQKRKFFVNATLATVWAVGIFGTPILFKKTPIQFRTFVMIAAMTAMVGSIYRAGRYEEKDSKILRSIERVDEELLKETMRLEFDRRSLEMDISNKIETLAYILSPAVPSVMRQPLLKRHGLQDFAMELLRAQQKPVEVLPPAEPKKEETVKFGGTPQLGPSGMVWSSPEIEFPIANVAEIYAKKSLKKTTASGLMLIAPRRTGKTTFFQAMIAYAHAYTEGQADYIIFDGKGTDTGIDEDGNYEDPRNIGKFLGIESDPDRFLNAADMDNVEEFKKRLTRIKAQMKPRKTPYFIIADEINNVLGTAKTNKHAAQVLDYCTALLGIFISSGSSQLHLYCPSTHELRVESVGMKNTALYQSMLIAILGNMLYDEENGSTPNFGAIEESLTNSDLIQAKSLRDRLQAEFQIFRSEIPSNWKGVLCLTNARTDWELVLLPNYSQMPFKNIYGDNAGNEQFTPQSQQEEQSDEQTNESFDYRKGGDDFIRWVSQQDGSISNEEIRKQHFRLVRMELSDDTLRYIRDTYLGKDRRSITK